MAVPKRRTTKTKRNLRRSHHAISATSLSTCAHCKRPVRPHQMCMECGYYKGNEVEDVYAKLTKRQRKKAERQEEQERADREASQMEQQANG